MGGLAAEKYEKERKLMPLRRLSETLVEATELSASVCIVGAGIAGLVAATRLARDKRRRVIVLESGLGQPDPSINLLNQIEDRSDHYQGALSGRSRGLGGTGVLWAGKLLPLNARDTQPRPELGLAGWPLDFNKLEPFWQQTEELLGVDRNPYDGTIAEQLDPDGLLPRNDVDFCVRWPKRPTPKNHNLAHVLRQEIQDLDNLEIWLGATVSGFSFDLASGRVQALTAIDRGGRTLRVMAGQYLLAAGTLESTRLLLLADRQSNHSISRECDALGRYFNDHLGLDAATVRCRNRTSTNKALSDRYTFGAARHLHFELRPDIQRENGIASAYFDIGASLPASSALTKAKEVVKGLKSSPRAIRYGDVHAILKDSPSLFWTAQWRAMRKYKYWPSNVDLSMKIWVEQLPLWQNRISLSDRNDALGVPGLLLEWKRTDAEEKVFRTMVRKIDRYWKQHLSPWCELEWTSTALNTDARMADSATDLAHPAGSTRMGTNPRDSVVDPDLRVHRMPNLSVASASVFPSSGSANPTFTIMLLSMRVAETLSAHC